jgi:hypothetical protein
LAHFSSILEDQVVGDFRVSAVHAGESPTIVAHVSAPGRFVDESLRLAIPIIPDNVVEELRGCPVTEDAAAMPIASTANHAESVQSRVVGSLNDSPFNLAVQDAVRPNIPLLTFSKPP